MIHYRDEFESTEQIIDVNFAMVYVILQQEAILRVMDLLSTISSSFEYVSVLFCIHLITFVILQNVIVFCDSTNFNHCY